MNPLRPRRPSFAVALAGIGLSVSACAALPVGASQGHVRSGYNQAPLRLGRSRAAPPPNRGAAARADSRPQKVASRPVASRVHVVAAGETLWRIARNNGTSVDELMAHNGITDVHAVRVGTRLQLPTAPAPTVAAAGADGARGGSLTAGAAPTSPDDDRGSAPVAAGTTSSPAPDHGMSRDPARGTPTPTPAASKPTSTRRYALRWPVDGSISSRFGRRWGKNHDGIDISAPRGTAVYAAGNGEVLFSGTHGGYGKLTLVRHEGGIVTVYAHQDQQLVVKGQRVTSGQLIGRIGMTGRTTGPHLHFEVRRGTAPQNPLTFLPP